MTSDPASIGEWVDPASLVPWEKNPRKNDSAVTKVAASIKKYGFASPIVARPSDMRVIAGHTRLKAALRLKLDRVPVRFVELTDAQAAELTIAENKLGEIAKWDGEALGAILRDLPVQNFGDLGWSADDLEAVIPDWCTPEKEIDAEPQIDRAEELRVKWGVERGQLWALGDHRLMCGDSTVAADVARLMGEKRAAACITDPPYSVNYDRSQEQRGGNVGVHAHYHEGDLNPSDILDFMGPIPADVLIWSYPIDRHFHALSDAYRKHKWDLKKELVWVKDSFSFWMSAKYQQKHEPIMVAVRLGKPIGGNVPSNATTVFEYPKPRAHDLHPTAKPMDLWLALIRNHSNGGDIVYEPFSGSGTTIIACEQLGRACYAVEISPPYVAIALQRWADATGKKPRILK